MRRHKKNMLIAQQYPSKIQRLNQHIYDLMDYFGGTTPEVDNLRQMVLAQNQIIKEILKAQYPPQEVPARPSGIWAPTETFIHWYNTTPAHIKEDMKKGEIVIVLAEVHMYKRSIEQHFEKTFNTAHAHLQIYVCLVDGPQCQNDFDLYNGTIDNKNQIITNFRKC